nr:hypothetical protein [Tanacetum cinerariifolium]
MADPKGMSYGSSSGDSRATLFSKGEPFISVSEREEISSRKKSFIKRAIAYIKIRRQANRVTRNNITRDRAGSHERFVATFFTNSPMYHETRFQKTFRMARPLFNRIVNAVNEYMQISERSSRKAFDHFCQAVMEIYGPEYLRKPTVTDIEKLYRHHKEKHRRDHGSNPFILLEVVASQDLWIWHAFFGVVGSNNEINVLYQSPLFNDLKTGRAPEIPFVANGVTYRPGCYLVDEIYPKLAPLVKTIPDPADDDHNRILYKQK